MNEGDGGDVRIDFTSGSSLTLSDFGSGIAGNVGSIGDLVDDPSAQVIATDLLGLAGIGFITEEGQTNELSNDFTITPRE